ncbi:hypothetical protein BJX62DRAFT_228553 [Aspergillus germanicus]
MQAVYLFFLLPALVIAQMGPLSDFFNITTFPNEQTENYFQDQCIMQQVYPALFQFVPGFVTPFKAFDNLFFIGHSSVSSWAYNTTEGVVVIDALNSQEEDIKHLIITHEHSGQYGGARMEQMSPDADPPVPTRDRVISNRVNLTVGDVTFHIILTPGHKPGTLSLISPIRDQGEHNLAGLSSGTGTPKDPASRDTLIYNHQFADHVLWYADLVAHRRRGARNPFVIGKRKFDKYLKINAMCSRVIAAREGQDLQV